MFMLSSTSNVLNIQRTQETMGSIVGTINRAFVEATESQIQQHISIESRIIMIQGSPDSTNINLMIP